MSKLSRSATAAALAVVAASWLSLGRAADEEPKPIPGVAEG